MDMTAGIMMMVMTFAALYILYQMMKSKAVIINPDGTFRELILNSKQTQIDAGKEEGVYNIRPEGFVRRLLFGLFPVTKIYFLKGCSEPVGFHSGKPIMHPNDLMLPVFAKMECEKCHSTMVRIKELIAAPLLRILLFESQTAKLGNPKPKVVNMKTLIYLMVIIGVVVTALVIASKYMGGISSGVTPTENAVVR
jgi:hypothetical protein